MHQSLTRYAFLAFNYLVRPSSEEPEEEQPEPENSLFLWELSDEDIEGYSTEEVARLVAMKGLMD
jgi:hypothetical protein